MTARIALGLLAMCVSCAVGCGNDDEARARRNVEEHLKGMRDPGPSDRYPTEGMIVRPFDLSDDNTADLWKIYVDERENIDDLDTRLRLVRKEVDSNFDRKVDIWFIYNARELLQRQESDADFDGHIDLIEHYEAGRIVRREVYKRTELPVATKHYRDGRLVKIELDDNADGAVDKWEIYSLGSLVQVGHDTNGDGKVDYWDDFGE